ncbi:MAG TPA: HD domain-containing protein [Firmicutes bacterium]|nr:HD domain-containing protein [Bacillota bacterium]
MDFFFQLLAQLEDALPDVHRHSLNTAKLALKAGKYMRLDAAALESLVTAAFLHDVGKLRIAPAVLHKPGQLAAAEWQEMVKHPRYSLEMLAGLHPPERLAAGVLYHHEWWNGEGYFGLRGAGIPPVARLLALCDSWDAMTSPRVYQPTKTRQEARQELERMRGRQFDPALVPLFLRMLQEEQSRSPAESLSDASEWLARCFQMYRNFHNPVVYAASLLIDDLVLCDVVAQCAITR